MFRGCSRTLKTPNSPPLHSCISANDENIDFYLPILPAYPQPLERPCISLDTMMFDYPVSKFSYRPERQDVRLKGQCLINCKI